MDADFDTNGYPNYFLLLENCNGSDLVIAMACQASQKAKSKIGGILSVDSNKPYVTPKR